MSVILIISNIYYPYHHTYITRFDNCEHMTVSDPLYVRHALLD